MIPIIPKVASEFSKAIINGKNGKEKRDFIEALELTFFAGIGILIGMLIPVFLYVLVDKVVSILF